MGAQPALKQKPVLRNRTHRFPSALVPEHKAGGNRYKPLPHTRFCVVPFHPLDAQSSGWTWASVWRLGASQTLAPPMWLRFTTRPWGLRSRPSTNPLPAKTGHELLPSWCRLERPALPSVRARSPGVGDRALPVHGFVWGGEKRENLVSPMANSDHVLKRREVPRSLLSKGAQDGQQWGHLPGLWPASSCSSSDALARGCP